MTTKLSAPPDASTESRATAILDDAGDADGDALGTCLEEF
jgi:hypothetical protein